jgi:hypothetical protein
MIASHKEWDILQSDMLFQTSDFVSDFPSRKKQKTEEIRTWRFIIDGMS